MWMIQLLLLQVAQLATICNGASIMGQLKDSIMEESSDPDLDHYPKALKFPFFFRGVQFEREVLHISDGIDITLTFGSSNNDDEASSSSSTTTSNPNCDELDKYGHNHCHFHWGDDVIGLLNIASLPYDLDSTSHEIIGNFTVDGSLPLNFACDVCGQPCSLGTIPVLDEEIIVEFPSCPLPASGFSVKIGEPLPSKAYIPETIITGTISVVSKKKEKQSQVEFKTDTTMKTTRKKTRRFMIQRQQSSSSSSQLQLLEEQVIPPAAHDARLVASNNNDDDDNDDDNAHGDSNELIKVKATIKIHW